MKVVIAPDSFKDSLTARQVANAIAAGLQDIMPNTECLCVPVADGGEGTMSALVDATGGTRHQEQVTGPLGLPVEAEFGLLGDGVTAVIEMATASGIELVPQEQRNPMVATSFGTGELVSAALDMGVESVIVAIGGSATNDGGIGMMTALGARFLDVNGEPVAPNGEGLLELASVDVADMDPRLAQTRFVCACDVDNPLTGEKGASAVFGPQKGATTEMIKALDAGMHRYAAAIKSTMAVDVETQPGAGAAGGMGAALMAFMQAELRPGIQIVLEAVELEAKLDGADLVITGEGRIDGQTIHGKTPVGVSRMAQKRGIPTIALAGALGDGCSELRTAGIQGCFSVLSKPCSLDDALANAEQNVRYTAQNLAGVLELMETC
jgi:glycerate kinase